jgi:hypothetical protein
VTVLLVCASSYETEMTGAFTLIAISFGLKFGEDSYFGQYKCEFSFIQTRNASKTFM